MSTTLPMPAIDCEYPNAAHRIWEPRRWGNQPCLVTPDRTLSYSDVDQLVQHAQTALAQQWRAAREQADRADMAPTVAASLHNSMESIVWYLACLKAEIPLLLLPTDPVKAARLVETWRPQLTIDTTAPIEKTVLDFGDSADSAPPVSTRREPTGRTGSKVNLAGTHGDLRLLLSTSGSTGSPKLVRLSQHNLDSNAAAIAEYLDLRTTDCGITSLPLSYCYGLSVLNSHLLVGARLVVGEWSVTDPCFEDALHRHGVTGFAGVPYTYDLLERSAGRERFPASLRYLTQAGGRLGPERVQEWASWAAGSGVDFFVMYGQTEATARMAYLPPDLASRFAHSIGQPIPGGHLWVADADSRGIGELCYSGPNVMMGYAETPADLGRGPNIEFLRTGDLARQLDNGLFEITGRANRIAKIFGLRIDLAKVEEALAAAGLTAIVLDCDERLGVVVEAPAVDDATSASLASSEGPPQASTLAANAAGIPPHSVITVLVGELPRLESGKPHFAAARELLATAPPASPNRTPTTVACDLPAGSPDLTESPGTVGEIFRDCLGLPPGPICGDSTFTSLGGDSMSYVVASVRLEKLLGDLPTGWQHLPVSYLQGLSQPVDATAPRRLWWTRMDTTVLIRALAIIAIVGSHIGVFKVVGGAHILIVIAGYNWARFGLEQSDASRRLRANWATIRRFFVPSALYIGAVVLIASEYPAYTLFGINTFGPTEDSPAWRYWYVEAALFVMVAAALLMAVPWLYRTARRWPFAWALALLAAGLAARYLFVTSGEGPTSVFTPVAVFWVFALGWALAAARKHWQSLLVVGILAVGLIGYFENPWRVPVILAAVGLIAFVPHVHIPRMTVPAITVVASASLFIYLSHWQVYPIFGDDSWLGLVASIAAGVGLARAYSVASDRAGRFWQVRRRYSSNPPIAPATGPDLVSAK